MPSEAVATTLTVTRIMEQLGIPYVIGGSMASTAYGRIRATMDVDIIADMQEHHIQPFLSRLGGDFYADETAIRQAIQRRSSFNLIHLTTLFKVDIFVSKNRPFDRQQLTRRQSQLLEQPDHTAFIASPEDVILAKLEWFRLGGEQSERQWRDVQGIFDVQEARLDRDYLRHWAAELGVADLLSRALVEYEARQKPTET